MPHLAPAALALLLAATLASASAAETRTFGAWTATCDAAHDCRAEALADAGAEGVPATFEIARRAQGTYWTIGFEGRIAPGAESPVNVTIDGETSIFEGRYARGAYDRLNRVFLFGDGAQPLLDALVAGTGLDLGYLTGEGQTIMAGFSLEGLAAALLFIDEQQGRIGAERVAYAPPEDLTPVSPGHEAIVPPALLLGHRDSGICDPLEDLSFGSEILVAPVDEQASVYFLPCTEGAYNQAYVAYIMQPDSDFMDEILFARFSEALGWQGTRYLYNPELDLSTLTLTAFELGRGIGDCGARGVWRWHEYGFKLLAFSVRDDCAFEGEPGKFPIVYLAPGESDSLLK